MGLDCIDLYYVHRVDPEIPVEITMEAMNELIAEGKIKLWVYQKHQQKILSAERMLCAL